MSTDRITLTVEKRETTGKAVAKLRRAEIVPAVIYGADFTPMNVQAPVVALTKVVREAGTHTPVELMIDGKKQTALIKSIDIDRAANRLQHVSFQAVSKDEIVTTRVPIVIVGEDESEAKKAGLIVLQAVEDLEVKAKPGDLPENLEISAADLAEHGDKLLVSDIAVPAGVELVDPDGDLGDLTIATVYEPSALAAANERADQAADEAAQAESESTEESAEETPAEQLEKTEESSTEKSE